MAVRSVSTLESFLLVGVVGTCLRKLANPSLTSFTLFLSLSFLRRIEACSFCGVRQRVRCPGAFGLELGELYSLLGDDDRGETGELTGEVTGESNGEPSDEGDGVGELSSDRSRSSRLGSGKAMPWTFKSNSMSVMQGDDKLTAAWRSHSLSLQTDSTRLAPRCTSACKYYITWDAWRSL